MSYNMFKGIGLFGIRNEVPKELEREFVTYKDIACIDRIQTSAWIGFILTICLFALDAFRYFPTGVFENIYYEPLFYIHLIGILFLLPAIHTTRNKKWITESRLRRGIVIWGMVVLIIIFLLGQSILAYLDRDSLVIFLGYIFVASWMFAMSNTERTLFAMGSILIMAFVIFYMREDLETGVKITHFIEITFLSITAFMFDAFDYNLNLANFMAGREIEKEQNQRRKLEEFKSRFFTNLTHELRTPITMISGMAREIAENPKKWASEGAKIISRNVGNLLNLVNQILELSKIESGVLPIRMVQGDLVSYVGFIVDAFKGHALARQIELHYLPDERELNVDYDPEKIMTILSNLIANAIKYTREHGDIYVSLISQQQASENKFVISIKDTGIGIPENELENIFERFYQAKNESSSSGIGTGIGLSLVSEYVQMLNGEIRVQSEMGKGTIFSITLPVYNRAAFEQHAFVKKDIKSDIEYFLPPVLDRELLSISTANDDLPDVLIIDDNADVVKYLKICLDEYYRVTVCSNGQEGIEKAIEIVPDLILSDVLMPVKDGLAVCRELKVHPVTNHIPIVLLSAKVDTESRIAGLESGADFYMVKPFEKKELLLQLHNLLERRRAIHARFSNLGDGGIDPIQDDIPEEDPFLIKARDVVQAHLEDSEFSVTHFCRAILLSRTQLHKKLKALTGMSATHFVRHIRLTYARKLLKSKELNITEIAYQVGFADPNYFTRCYGEEFGESPSETLNTLKNS